LARTDTPSPPSSPFRHTLRVYWEDTDAGGVVFYANYLKFFERARTEWLRALGFSQERLRTDTGAIFVVADTSVRYASPARLDDLVEVTVEPRDIGRVSMSVQQQAWRASGPNDDGPLLLAEGHIRIGCVDAGTFAPRRIPTAILEALQQ
jgi:acyl-CoA thioester hydrolase